MGFFGTSVNGLVVTRNFNFDPDTRPFNNAIISDGQLIIGSTTAPNVRVGQLSSSDSSIQITNGPGTINLTVSGGTTVGKKIQGNLGAAIGPTAGIWNIIGVANTSVSSAFGIFTSGSGSTLSLQIGAIGQFRIYQSQPGDDTYNVVSTDVYVGLTGSGIQTVVLPSPSAGRVLYIKDQTGVAASFNKTINANGSTIDGASTYVMNVNKQCITLIYNGSFWSIIANYTG
jgi:hypothetical protein